MAPETVRVLSGDCTVTVDATDRETYRGRVLALIKPDNTVLIHDQSGYQPVAWLTRADGVMADRDDTGGTSLVARKDGMTVKLISHESGALDRYPVSAAGDPVGPCPACDGCLIHSSHVHCLSCGDRYGIPSDATLLDRSCECGLPRMRVERGLAFDLCIDRSCESLDDAVQNAFGGVWECPDCDGDLAIIRRGGLMAGCDQYPDCEVIYSLPAGVVDGECDCGLPRFETDAGQRCLDGACPLHAAVSADP